MMLCLMGFLAFIVIKIQPIYRLGGQPQFGDDGVYTTGIQTSPNQMLTDFKLNNVAHVNGYGLSGF